jgi:hypothetical protein
VPLALDRRLIDAIINIVDDSNNTVRPLPADSKRC